MEKVEKMGNVIIGVVECCNMQKTMVIIVNFICITLRNLNKSIPKSFDMNINLLAKILLICSAYR